MHTTGLNPPNLFLAVFPLRLVVQVGAEAVAPVVVPDPLGLVLLVQADQHELGVATEVVAGEDVDQPGQAGLKFKGF